MRGTAVVALAAAAVVFGSAPHQYGEAGGRQALLALSSGYPFPVLSGASVANSGTSIVNGDIAVWPGKEVTGFPPGTVIAGTVHAGTAAAQQAQREIAVAYEMVAGQDCAWDLTGHDLGGKTLTPGVYCTSSPAALNGSLILDAQGDPAAVYGFKLAGTLTAAPGSSVIIANGGSACGVFWQIGGPAILGAGSAFVGNILAMSSITLEAGTRLSGRALSRSGAVNLNTNTVSAAACVALDVLPVLPAAPPASASDLAVLAEPPFRAPAAEHGVDKQPAAPSVSPAISTDAVADQEPPGETPTSSQEAREGGPGERTVQVPADLPRAGRR